MAATLLRRLTAAVALLAAACRGGRWRRPRPGRAERPGRRQQDAARRARVRRQGPHRGADQKLENSKKRQKQLQATLLAAQVEAKQLEVPGRRGGRRVLPDGPAQHR